jgi:DNA-binding NarL/FixJ family response regulator
MTDVTTTKTAPIVVGSTPSEAARIRFARLTPREREVALRIAKGERQARMARDLGISSKTVQTHREHAMLSLGVHTNQEIAILAFVAGLVPAP